MDRIGEVLWTRNPLDLFDWLEFDGPEVWATVDGLVEQWPLVTMSRTNTLTVEAGDRMLRVACTTERATYTPVYLPVRVLPGQTVIVHYTAPREKGEPATLGFTPS